jgi:hypothetical protein
VAQEFLWSKPLAVIPYPKDDPLALLFQDDLYVRGLGVLPDIPQRFLRTAEKDLRDVGGRLLREPVVEPDRQPSLLGAALQIIPEPSV